MAVRRRAERAGSREKDTTTGARKSGRIDGMSAAGGRGECHSINTASRLFKAVTNARTDTQITERQDMRRRIGRIESK